MFAIRLVQKVRLQRDTLTLYYKDVETRWNRVDRNYNVHVHDMQNNVSIFQPTFSHLSRGTSDVLMDNCVEVEPFLR